MRQVKSQGGRQTSSLTRMRVETFPLARVSGFRIAFLLLVLRRHRLYIVFAVVSEQPPTRGFDEADNASMYYSLRRPLRSSTHQLRLRNRAKL